MPARTTVTNFVLFQLGWFACVLGAAALLPWAGVLTVVAIVTFHLLRAPRPTAELVLISAAVVLGTLWDSLLAGFGWLIYPSGMMLDYLAPYWIIALWALFATTLNVSLRWLREHRLIATIAGAIGGPLAFYAGSRLGAVEIPDMPPTLALLSLGWALLTPTLLMFARRLDGFAPAPALTRTV